MYVSYLGERGALHLSKEVINNMIDECINPKSPGRNIDIYLDEIENTLSVSDDGRGIPFDKLELVCTKLQAGSKFTREGGGSTAGENGVGLTAVNALSDRFEIIAHRYGDKGQITFARGKKLGDVVVTKDRNKDRHGTTTLFQPSPFFMGNECSIPSDELINWVEKIFYITPDDITANFHITRKGKESAINKKYRNKNGKGLAIYTKKLAEQCLLDPIQLKDFMKSKEIDKGKELDRFIGLEFAFTFDSMPRDMVTDSFCNYVNTVDNGTHVDAVKQGIMQYFTKQTRDSLSDRDAKKLDITPADVYEGLILVVNLSTTMQPQFSGQTKEKMTSDLFFKPLKNMAYRGLVDYFKKNPKELKKITDYVKANSKARYEATKARNSSLKGHTTSLDEHEIPGFTKSNARPSEYRELFLIEGDSAQGSADQAKYNEYQATYALRGVPLNSFGKSVAKTLENKEFYGLVKILGCNIGERFNIDKLTYNKIIIMTDADVDGSNITSLLSAFFLKHLPEVVKRGYLYKSVSPLYRIKDKNKPFILNKMEYIEVFESRIGDSIKLIPVGTKVPLNSRQMKEFLLINRLYLDELDRLSRRFGINRKLMEFIVAYSKRDNFKEDFLSEYFPEIDIDKDMVLSGVYEGKYQVIRLDKLFYRRASVMEEFINEFNGGKIFYDVREKVGNKYVKRGIMTVGDLLALCQKFQPEIINRYKGLGELLPKQLQQTTLDPNNRILIKLTVKDLKEELKKFDILHGSDSDKRKAMMKSFKINREDLDN